MFERPFVLEMAKKKPEEASVEKSKFSDSIVRQSVLLERILRVEGSFLERSHEAVHFAEARIKHLFPDTPFKVEIDDREEEPNAFSLANGTIILTKGLLRLLETVEEVDFVLSHEATHYLQGHAQEIQDVLKEVRRRYQSSGVSVGDAVRILGTNRLGEYEADARGVAAAAKGGANPAAARSVFLKLDEYKKDKHFVKSDAAHGKNIARMVNITGMAAILDTAATTQAQTPLPAHLKTYAETTCQPDLFTRIREANISSEIETAVQTATVPDLLLTLHRTQRSRIEAEKDPFRRREMENEDYFAQTISKHLRQKVDQTFSTLRPSQRKIIVHALLSLCGGVKTNEASGTPFEKYTNSFEVLEEEQDIWNILSILRPEVFDQLGVVMPSIADLKEFTGTVIRAANENDLFTDETTHEFDTSRYLAFSKKIDQTLKPLADAECLESYGKTASDTLILREGVMNLDLARHPQHLLQFLKEMRASGANIDPIEALSLIDNLPKVTQDKLDQVALEQEITHGKTMYRAWRKTEQEIYEQISGRTRVRVDNNDEIIARDIAEELEKEFKPADIKDVEIFFRLIEERATIIRETEGSSYSNIIHRIEEYLFSSLLKRPIPEIHPNTRIKNLSILCVGRILRQNVMQNSIEIDFHLGIADRKEVKTNKETLSLSEEILQILVGTHPLFASLDIQPNRFHPIRLHNAHASADNYTLQLITQHILESLGSMVEKNEITPDEARHSLKRITTQLFDYVDRLPSEGAKTGFSRKALSRMDVEMESPEDQDFLLSLSCILQDEDLKARIQDGIFHKKHASQDFEEQLTFLFKDKRTKYIGSRTAREEFIERTAQTPAQLKKVEEVIEKELEQEAFTEAVGLSVLVEIGYEKVQGEEKIGTFAYKRNFFKLCLETERSDQALKDTLFRNRDRSMPIDGFPLHILATEARLDSLFAMDDLSRFGAIRELLIGEGGLLLTPENRKWLFQYLYATHVTRPDQVEGRQIDQILRETMGMAVQETDPDLVFFMLAPIIHDHFLRKPRTSTPWKDILKAHERMIIDGHKSVHGILNEIDRIRNGIAPKYKTARTEDTPEHANYQNYLARKKIEGLLQSITPVETKRDQSLQIEQFAVRLAESFGAPGIRFLQILGQYVDLPPSLQEAMRDSYDNVKRQSKLTSAHVIRREWPEFETEVTYLVERRGGGSLMTAYEARMQDGSRRIIKVLNANAMLFVKESTGALRKTFTKLAAKNPERYQIALAVLDEIEQWILEDITYEKFHETDPAFKQANHGYTVPGHAYKIYVPQSYPLTKDGKDNQYVKMEEFVEGKTLVRPEELPEHDQKQIASVIVKNYFHQLTQTTPLTRGEPPIEHQISLLHADVHPGNFMVGKDSAGESIIAIIDRNNYLELDERDRAFCVSAFSAHSKDERVETFLEYIRDVSSTPANETTYEEVEHEMKTTLTDEGTFLEQIPRLLTICKKRQVKVPLKLTLLVKNINGLNHLAKQSGFNDLSEAYTYSMAA